MNKQNLAAGASTPTRVEFHGPPTRTKGDRRVCERQPRPPEAAWTPGQSVTKTALTYYTQQRGSGVIASGALTLVIIMITLIINIHIDIMIIMITIVIITVAIINKIMIIIIVIHMGLHAPSRVSAPLSVRARRPPKAQGRAGDSVPS